MDAAVSIGEPPSVRQPLSDTKRRSRLEFIRKRLITPTPETIRAHEKGWLDVERAAVVEVTLEDKEFPVELAFALGDTRGGGAGAPNDSADFRSTWKNSCAYLLFLKETRRTQEFVLRWSPNGEDCGQCSSIEDSLATTVASR